MVEALAPAAELNETTVVDYTVAHRGSGGCALRGTARGTTDPARHPWRTRTRRGRRLMGEHAAVVAPLGGNKLESSTSVFVRAKR